MVGIDEEEIDWAELGDFSNECRISGVALHEFDIVEGEESLLGVRADFDVYGKDIARCSSREMRSAASRTRAEFDNVFGLKFLGHIVEKAVLGV